jgi:hypothetical protein
MTDGLAINKCFESAVSTRFSTPSYDYYLCLLQGPRLINHITKTT